MWQGLYSLGLGLWHQRGHCAWFKFKECWGAGIKGDQCAFVTPPSNHPHPLTLPQYTLPFTSTITSTYQHGGHEINSHQCNGIQSLLQPPPLIIMVDRRYTSCTNIYIQVAYLASCRCNFQHHSCGSDGSHICTCSYRTP